MLTALLKLINELVQGPAGAQLLKLGDCLFLAFAIRRTSDYLVPDYLSAAELDLDRVPGLSAAFLLLLQLPDRGLARKPLSLFPPDVLNCEGPGQGRKHRRARLGSQGRDR